MNNQDNYSYEEVLELTKQGIEIWRKNPITKHYDKHGNFIECRCWECEVSNLGRFRRTYKEAKDKECTFGSLNGKGYMEANLKYKKQQLKPLVNQLVASAFLPNPEDKPLVDHISTDKTNNKVDNLRWSTHKENSNNPNTKKNMSEAQKSKIIRNLTDEEKYPYVTEEDILLEEWKPIKGYEGIYEISNMGRVRKLGFKRNKFSVDGFFLLKPNIIKNKYGEDTYQRVVLTDKNDKKDSYSIHRLVAKTFYANPENKPQVDHILPVKTNGINDKVDNLRWSTGKENMNNPDTIKNKSRLVIVLDRNGNVLSSGLGVGKTAKKIGINAMLLRDLLKSHKPYKASIKSDNKRDIDSKSLNGIRAYYIDTYNEEEVMREIAEDKTDYSYCIGDVVCIYPDGKTTKPMCRSKLAKELKVNRETIRKIRDNKKPYKAPNKRNNVSKEQLEHLKTLNGIIIMDYEDYLKEQDPAK